jgi:hypothetical protein
MRWLLSWLFPLWALLPLARRLGTVSFQEVAGVGWQCSIRPPHNPLQPRRARGVNCWTGQAASIGASLREALTETRKTAEHEGSTFLPKLGGEEFDSE